MMTWGVEVDYGWGIDIDYIKKELEKQQDVYKMTAEEYMQLENKL